MLLTKSQQRYPHYQKLLLAIIMTSRKVSHYFDEHPITIVSSAPLADILNKLGETGRVAEWNIELSPRDLQFKHPIAIKAQVLPDFLVEWTEVQTPDPPDLSNSWTIFFDGSKRQQGAGEGVVLVSPKERSSDMSSRSTSATPPKMKQNTRHYFTTCAWPKHA